MLVLLFLSANRFYSTLILSEALHDKHPDFISLAEILIKENGDGYV